MINLVDILSFKLKTCLYNVYEFISVKPFIIGDGLTNIVVKKGQVIKYDIKYGGEPEPEVQWVNNDKEIKHDGDRWELKFNNSS